MTYQEIVKRVKWRDLRDLSLKEVLIENCLTIPWIASSWTLAYFEYYWLALPFSAVFFLTALRQVHNGFHYSLGTSKFYTWLLLYLNSILMIVSIHAVKFNHLRHHKYNLSEEDQEGKSAHMSWYGAILYGPIHFFKIHQITWKLGNRKYRRNLILELLTVAIFTFVVFYFNIHWLIYHTVVMIFGEFLVIFFAVWLVHRNSSDSIHNARTQRNKWKNKLTFSMFYHLEHHLFPAVPTSKLPELARRIDKTIPEIKKKQAF